jgi:hypothetical protein
VVAEKRRRIEIDLEAAVNNHAEAVAVAVADGVCPWTFGVRYGKANGLAEARVRLDERPDPCGLDFSHGRVVGTEPIVEGLLRRRDARRCKEGRGKREPVDARETVHSLI